MSFINIENVSKNFGQVSVLKGINLQLEQYQHLVIRGASGSGKSTLLHLIAGLDRPSGGLLQVGTYNVSKMQDSELALYRNKFISIIFQFHYLLPSMNSLDNILLPARLGGHDVQHVSKHIHELADKLDIRHCLHKFPYELSGGEQQRVNIVRAWSIFPQVLLCDEPTGNLDSVNSVKVIELLKELSSQYKTTLIIVTHDQIFSQYFDFQICMKDGTFLPSL